MSRSLRSSSSSMRKGSTGEQGWLGGGVVLVGVGDCSGGRPLVVVMVVVVYGVAVMMLVVVVVVVVGCSSHPITGTTPRMVTTRALSPGRPRLPTFLSFSVS